MITLFRRYYVLYALSMLSAVFLLAVTCSVLSDDSEPNEVTATPTPTQVLTTATESPLVPTPTSTLAPTPAPTLEATPAASPEPTAPPAPVATLAPEPAPVIQPGSFEALICSYSWPCGEAISVAACESGRDAAGNLDGNYASNGDSYGLFEINSIHAYLWPDFWTAWMDPVRNTAWAFELWSNEGWFPWACAPWRQ